MKFVVSDTALVDVELILERTRATFGPRQVDIYSSIIEKSLALIAQDPLRPSSIARSELGTGMRTLRLDITARRRGAAAHVVYYILTGPKLGDQACTILRVLHQGMELQLWLAPYVLDPQGKPT